MIILKGSSKFESDINLKSLDKNLLTRELALYFKRVVQITQFCCTFGYITVHLFMF